MTPEEVLEAGIESGLHLGAQLCVMRNGEVIANVARGEARAGVPMRTDSVVPWYSTGKPLTAIYLAGMIERRQLDLDDPVSRFIPEFGTHGKGAITIRHLLTHTGGFREADKIAPGVPWEEVIRGICDARIEEGWTPGEKGGYSTGSAWFILAEMIQRLSAREFEKEIKTELLDPLGMVDSWLRLPFSKYKEYGDRLALMHDTSAGNAEQLPLQDAVGMAICRPGSSARGPIRELTRFYAMLLSGGELEGRRYLDPETVALFTTRHRIGLYDHTFMHTLDFGLGFIVSSNRYGASTVPYSYGRYCSEETFGHSGAQSSCAFADPQHELVVAWVTNGMPGERPHQKRQRAINDAIYEHLRLS